MGVHDQCRTSVPVVDLRVGDAERHRAESLLQDAYGAGRRLDEVELDQRLGMVMTAQTRRDLNAGLAGLAPAARIWPASRPARSPSTRRAPALGAVAHLSGLVSWIFGPLFLYAVATPGTPGRREAAKAFNFQLVSGLACIVTAVVGGLLLPGELVATLMVTGWLGWLVLTVMGGARALSGQPWRNPVMQVVCAASSRRCAPTGVDWGVGVGRRMAGTPMLRGRRQAVRENNSTGGDWFRLGTVVPGEAGRGASDISLTIAGNQ